jgi:predicted GIY-YIG superfamily endonuclease
MLIYKVTNNINGKIYIGMTTLSLSERMKEHSKKFRLGVRRQAFYSALHKYGWDNFTWEAIEEVSIREDLIEMEKLYIEHYKSTKKSHGYNETSGGDGVICGESKKYYKVINSNGEIIVVHGWKEFCRNNGLNEGALQNTLVPYKQRYTKKDGTVSTYIKTSTQHKGFKLLGRFNDYPGREYTQVSGNGRYPVLQQDNDIVSSCGRP